MAWQTMIEAAQVTVSSLLTDCSLHEVAKQVQRTREDLLLGESSILPHKQSGAVHGTDSAETMRSHSVSVDVGHVREDTG